MDDDFGVPPFQETPIYQNIIHMVIDHSKEAYRDLASSTDLLSPSWQEFVSHLSSRVMSAAAKVGSCSGEVDLGRGQLVVDAPFETG